MLDFAPSFAPPRLGAFPGDNDEPERCCAGCGQAIPPLSGGSLWSIALLEQLPHLPQAPPIEYRLCSLCSVILRLPLERALGYLRGRAEASPPPWDALSSPN